MFSLDMGEKKEFLAWYKAAFKKVALPRLNYYADLYQLNYQQVRLKTQKTLWGSCSGVNNINLNYLLIMAPMNVIDYVIVHELAHTKIKNHSKDFWQLVESILPKYKASKSWLKNNGYKLHNL
jgi:predicted metal-dependent hydrolase